MPANDPITDGDTYFVGVNMRLDPGQLKPGFCASATNKRFINGKASTRPGIKKMPWSNMAKAAWTEKTYSTGEIVTYSGRAATVVGASAAIIEGGTGTITLHDTNAKLLNGDFSTYVPGTDWSIASGTGGGLGTGNTGWAIDDGDSNYAQHTAVTGTVSINNSGGYSTTVTSMTVDALAVAIPNGTTLTFSGGGQFILSARALIGATTITSTTGLTSAAVANDASATYASDSADNLYQDIDLVLGCDYTIVFTISSRTAGTVTIFAGTTGGSSALSTSTAHTVTITSKGQNPDRLYIQASADFDGRVDTISITEGATPEKVALRAILSIDGGLYNSGGPASNNSIPYGDTDPARIGPFFERVAAADPGTEPPLSDYNPSTNISTLTLGWSDLGSRTYGYSGTVYGAGIFRDPLSIEHILVATSDGVYATKEGNPSVKLPAPANGVSADVEFVQCFNEVIMFRGDNLEPLAMSRLDIGFVSISQTSSDTDIDENEDDGTERIPNASTGIFFANRLLIPHSKDLVAASDFLNYTRYQPILANFRINQGSEDELVSLVRINSSTIACFKTNSIYIVSNIYGNLTDVTLDEVTREYGVVSKNSIVQVGDDVVFLSSKKGVTSLGVAEHGKVSAVDIPMSEPIQPIIDRINWNYASGAAAAYHNNRLYMAVPLDDSTYNNVILIFDYLVGGWAGYDTGSAIKVKKFLETMHQGKRRLFFLDTDGFINLYDDALTECGFVDEVPASTDSSSANFGNISIEQISDELITRGYTAGDISAKKWKSAEVHLATSDPNFTIMAQFDGPEEDALELTPTGGQTFSRTSYDRPFDKADYVESMTNDDFMTKYRQDYSVDPDTVIQLPTGTCSLSSYKNSAACGTAGGTWTAGASETGFDPDLHQQSQNRYRYRGEGRYVQLKIANTNGRAEVLGAKVGAIPGQNLTTKMI